MTVRFASDSALLIEVPGPVSVETSRVVLGLFHALRAALAGRVSNFHPAFCSLLIDFDPARENPGALKAAVEGVVLRHKQSEITLGRVVTVPVVYDGEDLGEVARMTGLSTSGVAELHASADYTVAFLGFAPGFPYLRGLPERLHVARLKEPRTRVPRGSVAIAGANCGIYPEESPGGWRLLGRAAVPALEPGDRVRFAPVAALSNKTIPAETPRPEPVSVQDGAAFTGWQVPARDGKTHLGISPGGPADPVACAEANRLAGNAPDEPVLEVVARGEVVLRFETDTWLCVTGALCDPRLDQLPVRMWASLPVSRGQNLRLGPARAGLRAYVGVHRGHGSPGYARAAETLARRYRDDQEILRVTRGPQWEWFSADARERLFHVQFEVTADLSRKGVRLSGPAIEWNAEFVGREMTSEGIADGAIQVPPSGQPVILFCDQRTTGGYPKIANVARADLWKIGQLRPGQKLRLAEIPMEESWALLT